MIIKTTDGGTTWNQQTSGVTTGLRNVHFVTSSIGYAVGDQGVILKTTDGGTTWNNQTSGTEKILYSFFRFPSSSEAWVVGQDGIILYTADAGENWSEQTSGTNSTLNSLSMADTSNGWAVGVIT